MKVPVPDVPAKNHVIPTGGTNAQECPQGATGLLPGLGVLTVMPAGNAAARAALTDRNMAGEGLLGGTSFARGDFYGIDSLVSGEPFRWQLSTSTSGTAIGLFSFGFGFNGELIYSPAELAFYAIDELLVLGPGFVKPPKWVR